MENNHMNLEFIQKLADLVADKNLGEITVQNGDSTITVKGKKAAAQTVVESFRLQQRLLRWQPLRLRLHLLQKPKQLLRLASL